DPSDEGDSLEPQRTTQPADVGTAEGHEEAAQQSGKQAKGPGGDPEEARFESGQNWHDRREVNISERRVASAVEVVELIRVKPEGAVGQKMKGNDESCRASVWQPVCGTRTLHDLRTAHAGRLKQVGLCCL